MTLYYERSKTLPDTSAAVGEESSKLHTLTLDRWVRDRRLKGMKSHFEQ
jgi:hypothetical protein